MVLFSEDHIQETKRRGRIEVICGSMFSGKTEELIRRLKRAKFAKQRVEIFKPAIDTRYSEADVVSHDSHSIASTPIDSSASILLFTSEIDVVGIDEAQFFDSGLIDVCNLLANNGIRVIVAGLDMDFRGIPFGPMPGLCAIADEVSKVHAICVKCGQLASFSHRTVKNDKQVLLGETEEYEPLCRECYQQAIQTDQKVIKEYKKQSIMERKKITFDSFIRGVILGVIIIGILMLFKRLSGVLLPFFIAWLIAYLIYPLVTFFQYRLRLKNRVISIFCALFSILIAGGAAFYLLVPPMMDEFVRVKDLVIDYFSNGTHDGNVPKTLSEFLRENIDTQFVTQLFKEENMLNAIKETVPRLWSLLSESVNLLFSFFTFFLILLYIVFILLDYESISEGWTHLVPQKYRPFVINVMNDVKDGMNRYFRGQAFVALCVGILFSIGFLIIDFPLAIGLGLFIGALNLVPYLQIIGFIPTIVLAILKAADTGGNFWIIIASALAVFIIVQAIQDGFIVPRVMGKITGLNPAIILLSLSIWGSLMGMLGMIIALPLTTLMLSYYQRFIINREKIHKFEQTDNQQEE